MDREEIENRFGYHPPRSTARVRDHEFARGRCKDLAYQLSRLLPEGREKSTCITKLEEAMFWANAALARADDPNAISTVEEAAAGPRRLGEGEPALDRDDEEREAATLRKGSPHPGPAPHPFEMVDLPDVFDPYTCKRCGEHKEDEIHTDPREGLDPDEEVVEDGPPLCTVPIPRSPHTCAEPAFGYIIMGGGKKRPMCEYHWREDDSGHARERIR